MEKEKYIPRLIDNIIINYLADFTAVHIRGPKWCGKTYTSEFFANSEIKLNTKSQREEFDRMYLAMPLPTVRAIITDDRYGYLSNEGIYIIPIGCLKN